MSGKLNWEKVNKLKKMRRSKSPKHSACCGDKLYYAWQTFLKDLKTKRKRR